MWQMECLVDTLNADVAIKIIIKYFIWPFLNATSAFQFFLKATSEIFFKKNLKKNLKLNLIN